MTEYERWKRAYDRAEKAIELAIRYRGLLARCRKVLADVERSGIAMTAVGGVASAACPFCGEVSYRGHTSSCELAALLKEIQQ